MVGTCSTHWRDKKRIKNLIRNTKTANLGDLHEDGAIILKCDLKECDGRTCTGFIWLW